MSVKITENLQCSKSVVVHLKFSQKLSPENWLEESTYTTKFSSYQNFSQTIFFRFLFYASVIIVFFHSGLHLLMHEFMNETSWCKKSFKSSHWFQLQSSMTFDISFQCFYASFHQMSLNFATQINRILIKRLTLNDDLENCNFLSEN